MPKTKISEFSATPANNTDIDSINIAEGCAPSGINDAIRELMAQLKDFQTGAQGDSFGGPVNGALNGTIGATTPNTGAFTTLTTTGNVGINATISSWGSSYKALQIKNALSLWTAGSDDAYYSNNVYYDGTNRKYVFTGTAAEYEQGAGQHVWKVAASGTAGNNITFNEAMTLDPSGNLGIGTTSIDNISGYKSLHIGAGSVGSIMRIDGTSGMYCRVYNNNTDLILESDQGNTGASSTILFKVDSTEKARIDSGGNLLLGTTTLQGRFTVTATGSTTIDCARTETSNSNQIVFRNGNGAVGSITTNGSATAYNTSSDYRLKNTIAPMTGALAKVSALNPVTYKWNVDGTDGEGFIAHELAEVCPQAVSGQKDAVDESGNPVYQGIDVSFLVSTLTAAIQELNAKFEAYKASHP